MRAVRARQPGGPEVLEVVDVDPPRRRPGHLLVEVEAAGVNNADASQRAGRSTPPPGATDVLGLEVAGTVVEVGEDVEGWAPGDRVMALLAGGGYAEQVSVPAAHAVGIPEGWSSIEAASIPEAYCTVLANLCNLGRIGPGDRVLVHGGAGGVGSAAIQLAADRGCTVYATAGSAAKADACRALGAAEAIVYPEVDFVAAVADLTGDRGVDVVLDVVGGGYVARNLRALAVGGRLVMVGLQDPGPAELDCRLLLGRRLTVTGSTLRWRDDVDKALLARQLAHEVVPRLATGHLRAVVGATFALDEVADAHRALAARDHVGNIVLRIAS